MGISIIDHLTVGVKEFEKSKEFYIEVLGCLGYDLCLEFPGHAAFGKNGNPSFWIGQDIKVSPGLHFCFIAESQESVDKFYNKAIELGAKDNGKPGLRNYASNYYASYVIDQNGYKIESVCRG